MKKLLFVVLLVLILLLPASMPAYAAEPYAPGCTANNGTVDPAAWNANANKPIGLVPCGISTGKISIYKCRATQNVAPGFVGPPNRKEVTTSISGDRNDNAGRAQCTTAIGQGYTLTESVYLNTTEGIPTCPCILNHFFIMAKWIYDFIVFYLAIPLAGLILVIGGVLFALAGAKPDLASTARTMLWGAGIGLLLIFTSYLIIHTVFWLLGYTGSWWTF